MADMYVVTHEDMTSVADEIRAKSGKSGELVFPEGWKETVKALSAEEQLKASEYPSYVHDEVLEIVNKVRAVQKDDSIVFVAMSDSHYCADQVLNFYETETNASAVQANQAAKALAYLLDVDFFAHLGDVSCGANSTTPAMLQTQIDGFVSYFREAKSDLPVFICIGNHDAGIYYHDAQTDGAVHTMTGEYLYKNFTAHSESDDTVVDGEEYGGYCYRDFADKKLRVIMLNTSEKLVGAQIDNTTYGAQRLWLANALLDLNEKDDAAEWGFIILSHYPADYGATMTLSLLLEAYVKGTSFTITDPANSSYYKGDGTNQTVVFTGKNGAKFIAQFHGHIHNFLTSKLYSNASGSPVEYEAQRICVPNGQYNRENTYGTVSGINFAENTSYQKTKNTAEGTSFVVNVINPTEQVIHSFCYGAGYDRVIGFGSTVYHSINKNLTLASVTDESGTSIENGGSYSAKIVADADCTIQSVVITMGGVDITSTAYNESTGVVSISEVTGTVSITVVAKAPPVNLITRATTTDGVTIFGEDYNGDGVADGYKKGMMLGSSTEYTDANFANGYSTGWITVNPRENTLVIQNIQTNAVYYTDSRLVGYARRDITSAIAAIKFKDITAESDGSYIITPDMWSSTENIVYIRVSGSYMGNDSSITIAE